MPSRISGTIRASPSKSVTHRGIVLAALSGGPCTILRPLLSDDTPAPVRGVLAPACGRRVPPPRGEGPHGRREPPEPADGPPPRGPREPRRERDLPRGRWTAARGDPRGPAGRHDLDRRRDQFPFRFEPVHRVPPRQGIERDSRPAPRAVGAVSGNDPAHRPYVRRRDPGGRHPLPGAGRTAVPT